MELYSHSQRRWTIILLILALGTFLAIGMSSFLVPLFGSVIFYKLFQRPYRYLHYQKNWNKHLVATLIIIFSLLVIILPFFTLTLMLVRQIGRLASRKEEFLQGFTSLRELIADLDWLPEGIIPNFIEKASTWISGLVPDIVTGAGNTLIAISILYFVMYFMFVQEKSFVKLVKQFSPFRPSTNERLDVETQNVVYSNIIGQTLISLVQGSTMALGFYIFGFNNPVLWGLVAFFVSFLPVVGTPLVWWPAGIGALLQNDYYSGLGIIIYGFVVTTQIDNVLRFIFNKWIGNIHPLITVLGVLFGLPTFGILGLVIGPLMISIFMLLLQAFYAEFAKEIDDPNEKKEEISVVENEG